MADEMYRRVVREGYDAISKQYLARKDPADPVLLGFLDRLAQGLSLSAVVLALGCGAGVPAARWLAERLSVVGLDLSWHQLVLARAHVPSARLLLADLAEIDFPARSFDAVVSLHAIIHVPRTHTPRLSRGFIAEAQ